MQRTAAPVPVLVRVVVGRLVVHAPALAGALAVGVAGVLAPLVVGAAADVVLLPVVAAAAADVLLPVRAAAAAAVLLPVVAAAAADLLLPVVLVAAADGVLRPVVARAEDALRPVLAAAAAVAGAVVRLALFVRLAALDVRPRPQRRLVRHVAADDGQRLPPLALQTGLTHGHDQRGQHAPESRGGLTARRPRCAPPS